MLIHHYLTHRMVEICAPLDINTLDHFLIGATKEISFKEGGWF